MFREQFLQFITDIMNTDIPVQSHESLKVTVLTQDRGGLGYLGLVTNLNNFENLNYGEGNLICFFRWKAVFSGVGSK